MELSSVVEALQSPRHGVGTSSETGGRRQFARVEGLCARFGTRQVLEDIRLRLVEGRTLVLLGPGGSGKSTLVKILGGKRPAELKTTGRVEVMRAGLQWMPQRLGSSSLTLGEILKVSLRLPELPVHWRSAPEAAELLQSYRDVSWDELPLEARRLAMVTQVLAHKGSLELLDEPTADLDPRMVGWIAARLESERPRGARLVVTHDLGLARRIADEAALLVEGRIVECAEIVTFFENPGQARTREFTRLGS